MSWILDHGASERQEQAAMAERVGMVVPRGDLDLPGSNGSNASERSKTVSPWWAAMAFKRATGSARAEGESALPTRGMITIASGMPAIRHSSGDRI